VKVVLLMHESCGARKILNRGCTFQCFSLHLVETYGSSMVLDRGDIAVSCLARGRPSHCPQREEVVRLVLVPASGAAASAVARNVAQTVCGPLTEHVRGKARVALERERRATVIEILNRAPAGTVITDCDSDGRMLRVEIPQQSLLQSGRALCDAVCVFAGSSLRGITGGAS